jgi:hypothetical protein
VNCVKSLLTKVPLYRAITDPLIIETSVGSARKNRPAVRCGNFGLAGGVAEVSAFHRIIRIKTLFVNLKVLFLSEKAIFNVVTLVTRDIPESPQGKISCARPQVSASCGQH